jgi:beta-glucosidase
VQSTGKVAACIKHFAVNNQESHRFVVNAVVDERTARELYYRSFEIAIKAGNPSAVMCAYNRINGPYCSENKVLLGDILRDEWGYSGITMTDWGATNSRVEGIRAGMDLEMPGSHGVHYWDIVQAINTGQLSLSDVDTSTQRMLNLILEYGTSNASEPEDYDERDPMWLNHYNLALKAAMDCCVLLKNDDDFLPLRIVGSTKIAVIGEFAKVRPRYQGMGSSQVHSVKVTTAFDELSRHVSVIKNIMFSSGYDADDDHVEHVDSVRLSEAVDTARRSDVVLLFIGLPEIVESEGFDRDHIGLPAQHIRLVEDVCAANSNTVVILSNGSALEMPWHVHPKAILEGYLLGEAGGAAVVDLIFGEQSPCGKLAETLPLSVDDAIANKYFPGNRDSVEYREGLLVGYRFFDTYKESVLYPFGHGLSYTKFSYNNLKLNVIQDDEREKKVEVTLSVQNTGTMTAKEVIQCYIHDLESTVFRPEQELKDFKKILLSPGECLDVQFQLDSAAFSFYDIGNRGWIVERGEFEVRIGSSSRDIRLRGIVVFHSGPEKASPLACSSYPPINSFEMQTVDDVTFANRFGEDKISVFSSLSAATTSYFHRNSLLKEVAEKRYIGKMLIWIVFRTAAKEVKKGPKQRSQKRLIMETVKNLPLRTLVLFSKGCISFHALDACICLMNGQLFGAIKCLCKSTINSVRPKR